MGSPVLFFAFANDRDDYLPMINRERKNLSRILRQLNDDGIIHVKAEAGATLEDIFEVLTTYDNVVVFHYGGHAGGTQLKLELEDTSTQGANAVGLAQLLGMQESLQLVFLNGCATKPQVELLLQHGVKAVIATSVPIQDKMATEFAEQFYYALANHNPITRAFQIATAFIAAKYDDFPAIKTFRGIILEEEMPDKELPWGLFINDNAQETNYWTLPKTAIRQQVLRTRIDYESKVEVNDLLIDIICEEIAAHNPDLDYELSKEDLDIPAIKREIVDSFPTPIGEQLRKLFTRSNDPNEVDDMERFTLPRLEQLALTYQTTVQFLCFTILSQLWDARFKDPALEISTDYIVDFNSFFSLNSDNYQTFNYVRLIRTITDIFDEKQIPYFIEELHKVKFDILNNEELFEAYQFLYNLRVSIIEGDIDTKSENLEELCLEAEKFLGIILRELAFLVKYKLATIKNIELIKNRHEQPRFRHNQIILNRALTVASIGTAEVGVEFNNFTDSKCVLFLKTKDDEVKDFLNLTPFIIDENALTSDYSTKLFLYLYQDHENYYYQFLNNCKDPPIVVNEEHFSDIKQQFDRFKAEIFGKEYQPQAKPKVIVRKSRFSRKKG